MLNFKMFNKMELSTQNGERNYIHEWLGNQSVEGTL